MSTPSSRRSFASLTRRQFIYASAMAASATALTGFAAPKPKFKSPNEKLDLGIIGCGGKGQADSQGLSGENIVALCDVDADSLAAAAKKWPNARCYRDYRVMIEKEKSIDAVTVSIPDHQHAPAAMLAIKAGKHVYCQKPLTHTVSEARALTLAARKYKVMTQMGNQGHSSDDIRKLCEMIWSGAIGPVREAHCWTNRPIWPQGRQRPSGQDPVPSHLDWNLWIGSSQMRPFVEKWPEETTEGGKKRGGGNVYHPFAWRGWWDFGCGALGDMACHVMDGANWALKLGAPTSVELVDSSPICTEMAPSWSILRYHFPARGENPPCTLTWYDGGKLPERPKEMEKENFGQSGTIFIGDKGKIMCDEYCDRPRLLPESSMADYKRPDPTIPRVPENNPYLDFARACKGGPAACSNFDVSGPFTEMVLLGNLALRIGKKIEWDSAKMRVKNCPEADQFIHAKYRKGWSV
ncbi:MAG: iolG 1 [Pedosphaera sp.]|nr:iolG 1 [Pedosphaera sp.]